MTDHTPDVHGDSHGGELVQAGPIADPGLPEHTWRPTDVDPKKEKRAERQVAGLFGLSALCTVLFVVSYFVFHIGDHWTVWLGHGVSTIALGLTLGLALLFIGVGMDEPAVRAALDDCLAGVDPQDWFTLEDPFPAW